MEIDPSSFTGDLHGPGERVNWAGALACWFDGLWPPAMRLPGGPGQTQWDIFATRVLEASR